MLYGYIQELESLIAGSPSGSPLNNTTNNHSREVALEEGGSASNALAGKRRARFASEDIGSNLTTKDSQDSSDKDRKFSFPTSMDGGSHRTRCGSINIVSIYSEKDDITIISTPDDGVVQRI
jgi:hypothetical protein